MSLRHNTGHHNCKGKTLFGVTDYRCYSSWQSGFKAEQHGREVWQRRFDSDMAVKKQEELKDQGRR